MINADAGAASVSEIANAVPRSASVFIMERSFPKDCDRIVTPESHTGSDAFFSAACP
jgi:hypothetical protein